MPPVLKRMSIAPAVALLAALFMVLSPHQSGTVVRLRSFAFAPNDVRIAVGEAVTFDNISSLTHTATCVRCPAGVDSRDVQPGLVKRVTFRVPGTYILACRYHQNRNMVMRIQVGPPAPPSPSPASPSPS